MLWNNSPLEENPVAKPGIKPGTSLLVSNNVTAESNSQNSEFYVLSVINKLMGPPNLRLQDQTTTSRVIY